MIIDEWDCIFHGFMIGRAPFRQRWGILPYPGIHPSGPFESKFGSVEEAKLHILGIKCQGAPPIEAVPARVATFRFVDDPLNQQAIRLMQNAGLLITVDEFGVIHYSTADWNQIWDVLNAVRDSAFGNWKILCFPENRIDVIRDYMRQNGVEYQEESAMERYASCYREDTISPNGGFRTELD